MKLPFSFGSRFIFRLFLPGIIISLGSVPTIDGLLAMAGYAVDAVFYIPVFAVVLGWLFPLLDMPIYMAFEGRRYWPTRVRGLAVREERRRLEALIRETNSRAEGSDKAAYVEAALRTTRFPLSDDGERIALYPTRLGNLIAEYEQYPTLKYGMDGVFYWYRIWVGLPKDLRDELDEHQALVDSSLYVSFALYLCAFFMSCYGVLSLATGVAVMPTFGYQEEFIGALVLTVSGYLIYRISLVAHAQYGNFFKAMFDRFHTDVQSESVLESIADLAGEESIRSMSGREARMVVWRYLQWHQVRLPGDVRNRNISAVAAQADARRGQPLVEATNSKD